jgi:hypothetical protein
MNNKDDTKKSVADRVLAYIEKENVQPRSKWYFIFTNDFFWALGALSVVMGALSFAVVLFTYFNAEPELYAITHDSFLDFIFEWIPIIWMVSFVIFTYVGYKNIQNTRRGYKYPFSLIIVGSVLLSFIGGIVVYYFGFAAVLDTAFERHVPGYRSVVGLKRDIALRPQRGVIGGEVVDIANDFSSFTIRDFRGGVWTVTAEELMERDRDILTASSFVRVVGIPSTTTIGSLSTNTMRGCAVLPWKIGQGEKIPSPPKMPHRIVGERKERHERNSVCKDVQPYLIIQEIRNKKDQ